MAEKRKVGFFGVFFNVKQWIAIDDILMHSRSIKKAFNELYNAPAVPKRDDAESFEAVMQRLNVSENDIEKRQMVLLFSALSYLLFGLGLVGYMFYLLTINGHFLAIVMTIVLAALVLVYAFRAHFCYMQICRRKLGGNLRDWVNFILRRAAK